VKVSAATAAECRELSVRTLGIDEAADLLTAEGLAASLRRAASFLCPASPRQIADAVLDALLPLASAAELARDDLAELLDLLVSAGDLIELPHQGDAPGRLLFLGPPSYVERHPGRYLLTGIRPFGAPITGPDLAGAIQYEGHTRTIELSPAHAASLLAEQGIQRIKAAQWIRRPKELPASALLAQVRQRLAVAGPAGEVEGLEVTGPETKVTYYRGRKRPLKPADSGVFTGRRPQAYGADLWCVVAASAGKPAALIDFPVEDSTAPGRDEAWRVQAAIDADRNAPQVFRVCGALGGGRTVDFFSPLPRWAERYLELTGTAVPRTSGALFSYRVPEDTVPGLADFLGRTLWMREQTTEGPA
jgi:hypothetical protein